MIRISNGRRTILADEVYDFGQVVVVGCGSESRFDPRCPMTCYFCQKVFGEKECAMTPKDGQILCMLLKNGEIVEDVKVKKCALMSDVNERVFDVEMNITSKGETRQLMASEMHGFGWYRKELQCQKRVDH